MAESTGVAPTWQPSLSATGIRVDIIGWGGGGTTIVNAVVGAATRHEDMRSMFRPSPEVSRLNVTVALAGCGGGTSHCRADPAVTDLGPVVSGETDRLLCNALALAGAIGEALNPLIGPLATAWDVKPTRATYVVDTPLPPAPSERVVEVALHASSWDLLLRVGERCWAMDLPGKSAGGMNMPDPSLGLGDIAKGCTADACHDLTVATGACGVLVSVGTSSVPVFGTRADGSPQRAGLRDPQGGPTSIAGIVELPAGGVALLSTSGSNLGLLGGVRTVCVGSATGSAASPLVGPMVDRRAREISRETSVGGGRILGHHIIDLRMGCPAHAGVQQVNVVASSGVLAGVLSTALLVDSSIDVSGVVARWSRLSGALASTKVVDAVRVEQR